MIELVTGFILVGVLILLLIFLASIIWISISGAAKKRRIDKQKTEDKGAWIKQDLYHIEGLPIAENSSCSVYVTPEGLSVENGSIDFKLDYSKILAAEVKTDTEIANIVNSSAVKGVVGGLIFGPIGLIVGSRATNKEKKTETYYLIINYVDESEQIKALMFQAKNSFLSASVIAERIKPFIQYNPKKVIEL